MHDLIPWLANIAGALVNGRPQQGGEAQPWQGTRGTPEAKASLSTLKSNARFGEIKCHKINSQYQLKNASCFHHNGLMVKSHYGENKKHCSTDIGG